MAMQMQFSECGAHLEKVGRNKWCMLGHSRRVEIKLCDEGGWDVEENGCFVHLNSLHIAMSRAYDLVTGNRKYLADNPRFP